jgi:hypothetical protein
MRKIYGTAGTGGGYWGIKIYGIAGTGGGYWGIKIYGTAGTGGGYWGIKTDQAINDILKGQNIIGFIKKTKIKLVGTRRTHD